nr:hypothetical protein CFP56_62002 [Quercus suber]
MTLARPILILLPSADKTHARVRDPLQLAVAAQLRCSASSLHSSQATRPTQLLTHLRGAQPQTINYGEDCPQMFDARENHRSLITHAMTQGVKWPWSDILVKKLLSCS